MQPCLRWLEWRQLQPSILRVPCRRAAAARGWGALVAVSPAQLLLCFPVALAGHLGHPGCKTCWSSCSEWHASPRGCSFFNPTFFPRTFPQFQKYLCRALQKPSGALLSRKSVWLLSESVRLISLKNKALGLGLVGVVAKEASLVLQKKCSPNQTPPGCITKDQNKQVQTRAVAPYFLYGALCSFSYG